MKGKEIFIPHKLKTIEIDTENKIFRVNGEDFGKNCTGFSINCSTGNRDNWFDITVRIDTEVKYINYNFDGEKTKECSCQTNE